LDAQLTTSASALTNAASVEIVAAEAMYSEREGFIITENRIFTAHTHMGVPVSFVLDRVTPQNSDFWKTFVENQREEICRYSQTEAGLERSKNINYSLMINEISFTMGRVIPAFISCAEKSHIDCDDLNVTELWIAFVTRQQFSHDAISGMIDENKIELLFTVNTVNDFPVTTHFGISRTANSVMFEDARQMRHLSVPLHAFSGKAMALLHPEKRYMYTTPVAEMKDILEKTIDSKCLWTGSLCSPVEIRGREFGVTLNADRSSI
jgi:hypothetical protein